ncbi:MAG: hypothetical protein WD036_11460 [Bauldia sp.]
MATNLRKFVNLKFLKTCDLALMRQLMSRYRGAHAGIDLKVFNGEEDEIREALRKFFERPESGYPQALVADLHRIADLGTGHGMRRLLERAKVAGVALSPIPKESDKADAKYVALKAFLEHREVFDAASDLLSLETTVALTELRGGTGDTKPTLNRKTKAAFEAAAKAFFSSEKMGSHCRIGWYDDGDEVRIVAVHGTEIETEWVVEGEKEKVISFRPLGTTVLAYDPVEGRLKVGGLPKAQRPVLAAIFARTILKQETFFDRDDAGDLYTLDPVENAGFAFRFDHRFDQGVRSVKVVEAQADRIAATRVNRRANRLWSVLIKDRNNALERMGQVTSVSFGPAAYRLAHIAFRVEFESEARPHPRVTVQLAPPGTAAFKRERFEGRIMDLLRRNGLCLDRKPAEVAVAAE